MIPFGMCISKDYCLKIENPLRCLAISIASLFYAIMRARFYFTENQLPMRCRKIKIDDCTLILALSEHRHSQLAHTHENMRRIN